jgi:two-component system sensor histidine kinase MtrB
LAGTVAGETGKEERVSPLTPDASPAADGQAGAGQRRRSKPARLRSRFRRRLTIAFVAVAGTASGILAVGSYVTAAHYRSAALLERTRRQAELNLAVTAGVTDVDRLNKLFGFYREHGDVETMVITPDGRMRASLPSLGPGDIPPALRGPLPDGRVVIANAVARKTRYYVAAGQPPDSGLRMYFFVSREGVLTSLETMRTWLAIGWALVVLLAALAGAAIARATLTPVRITAQAARSLAEGLLSTRLPSGTDDEFGALFEHFNQMADALEQKIVALSDARDREKRFTMFAAHELRTPLTAMSTAVSLLSEDIDKLPARARRPAELLIADVERLRRLVLNLLELGRLDSAVDAVAREPIRLDEVVEAAAAGYRWGSGVRLELAPVSVVSDWWSLERIVVNLVENAVRHGQVGVALRLGVVGGNAVVEVSDRGPGIAEQDVPHLFDRFYTTERSTGGTGLGLAIVREHADRIGATLDVRTGLGQGMCVTVTVPGGSPAGGPPAALPPGTAEPVSA